MMRRIVFLERVGMPSVDRSYRIAFRLTVPEARRSFYATASATSADRFAPEAEITALRAGEVVEVVDTLTAPAGATDEQAFALLQGSHARRQKELEDRNPFDNYGTNWDGATWQRVTVA